MTPKNDNDFHLSEHTSAIVETKPNNDYNRVSNVKLMALMLTEDNGEKGDSSNHGFAHLLHNRWGTSLLGVSV